MNMYLCIWLIISLSFLVLEIGHPGLLFFLSFSLGSLVSAFFAYVDYPPIYQIGSFFGATILFLIFLRFFIPHIHRSGPQTNVYALIGKTGYVVEPVGQEIPGYVKVQGEVWLARSLISTPITKGSLVRVIDVRGAHIIVKEEQNSLL